MAVVSEAPVRGFRALDVGEHAVDPPLPLENDRVRRLGASNAEHVVSLLEDSEGDVEEGDRVVRGQLACPEPRVDELDSRSELGPVPVVRLASAPRRSRGARRRDDASPIPFSA